MLRLLTRHRNLTTSATKMSRKGLVSKHLDIDLKDGSKCDSFMVHPEVTPSTPNYPTVLLFMDAFGPREYLYEMAESIAERGYFVLLPNLFFRIKRAPVMDFKFPVKPQDLADARNKFMPIFMKFSPEQAIADISEIVAHLKTQKAANASKVGITGYCFGGGMAIRIAGSMPDVVACAACFHGGNLATKDKHSPHLYIPKVKGELYFGNADKDASLPDEQVNLLKETLNTAKVRYEMELYKDALHGFTMKDLPVYNAEALRKHDAKLFALLDRNLKTRPSRL